MINGIRLIFWLFRYGWDCRYDRICDSWLCLYFRFYSFIWSGLYTLYVFVVLYSLSPNLREVRGYLEIVVQFNIHITFKVYLLANYICNYIKHYYFFKLTHKIMVRNIYNRRLPVKSKYYLLWHWTSHHLLGQPYIVFAKKKPID